MHLKGKFVPNTACHLSKTPGKSNLCGWFHISEGMKKKHNNRERDMQIQDISLRVHYQNYKLSFPIIIISEYFKFILLFNFVRRYHEISYNVKFITMLYLFITVKFIELNCYHRFWLLYVNFTVEKLSISCVSFVVIYWNLESSN